jgi:hypothetical protein
MGNGDAGPGVAPAVQSHQDGNDPVPSDTSQAPARQRSRQSGVYHAFLTTVTPAGPLPNPLKRNSSDTSALWTNAERTQSLLQFSQTCEPSGAACILRRLHPVLRTSRSRRLAKLLGATRQITAILRGRKRERILLSPDSHCNILWYFRQLPCSVPWLCPV